MHGNIPTETAERVEARARRDGARPAKLVCGINAVTPEAAAKAARAYTAVRILCRELCYPPTTLAGYIRAARPYEPCKSI